jgi:hypothetical protein
MTGYLIGEKNGFFGKKHTEETKKKMSDSSKGMCKGEKNGSFGTCWITKYNEDENFDEFKYLTELCKKGLLKRLELVIGIPKEEVMKNGVIINSEYVRENINEKDKKSDLLISIGDNVINLEMDRRYYSGSNKKNNKYIHKIVN